MRAGASARRGLSSGPVPDRRRARRSSTANSSPPVCATVPPGHHVRCMRPATACSSASPTLWPRVSLSCLKRSRSENSRAPRCHGLRVARSCLQPLEQQAAVGQAGEGVVVGQVEHPFVLQLALGDVGEHRHERRKRSLRSTGRLLTSTGKICPRALTNRLSPSNGCLPARVISQRAGLRPLGMPAPQSAAAVFCPAGLHGGGPAGRAAARLR